MADFGDADNRGCNLDQLSQMAPEEVVGRVGDVFRFIPVQPHLLLQGELLLN